MEEEIYIKMCEKGEEIRSGHKWEYGDWLIAEHGIFQIGTATFKYDMSNPNIPPIRSELPIATIQSDDDEGTVFSGDLIWLPHQDQLQKMVLESWPKDEQESRNISVVLLDDFQEWVLNDCTGLDWSHSIKVSMKQLWFAFVMKEKYGKVWDSEKEEWKELAGGAQEQNK